MFSSPSATSRSSTIFGRSTAPPSTGAELPRLVVVERDHGARLVVAGVGEPVKVAAAVVVLDHGQPPAGVGAQRELPTRSRAGASLAG